MKKLFYQIGFLILIIIVFSCVREEEQQQFRAIQGKEFSPLNTGNYIIYKITEIKIDKPSNVYDTSIYFLKEIVDIPFIDNQGDTSYRIERYITDNENLTDWQINCVWQAKLNDHSLQKVEENIRIVKIRFPIKKGLKWDGNLYNELPSKIYEISLLNTPYSIGNIRFDSCLVVLQDSSSSLIHKDFAVEVYANKIGLIYKESTCLNSQEVIFDLPIEERVTTGSIYKQEFINSNLR